MFYVSKLAQNFILDFAVPPTALIGFKDNNRFMWNDPLTGRIKVKTSYISSDDV